MSAAEGLGKFGLFLSLVFILPGIIYVGFVTLYFPDILGQLGWNLNDSAGLLGLSVFLGFVLTSITASIEVSIIRPIFKKLHARKKSNEEKTKFEMPSISRLGYYEAKKFSTFYITQVFGQYICHLNVSLGVLLLAIAYVSHPYFFMSYFIMNTENLLKLSFGLFVSLANGYLSLFWFRRISLETIEHYRNAEKGKHYHPID